MKLNFKVNSYSVDLGDGLTVNVVDRVPISKKNAIVLTCIKGSSTNNILSRIEYEASLYAMIIITYTDIKDKIENFDKMSLLDFYDLIDSNGIITKVISTINQSNQEEIPTLLKYAEAVFNDTKESLNSAGSAILNLTSTLNSAAAFLGTIMKEDIESDKEKGSDEATPAKVDLSKN